MLIRKKYNHEGSAVIKISPGVYQVIRSIKEIKDNDYFRSYISAQSAKEMWADAEIMPASPSKISSG